MFIKIIQKFKLYYLKNKWFEKWNIFIDKFISREYSLIIMSRLLYLKEKTKYNEVKIFIDYKWWDIIGILSICEVLKNYNKNIKVICISEFMYWGWVILLLNWKKENRFSIKNSKFYLNQDSLFNFNNDISENEKINNIEQTKNLLYKIICEKLYKDIDYISNIKNIELSVNSAIKEWIISWIYKI
jgi:ATP-dependent protease ClpP protease subunit